MILVRDKGGELHLIGEHPWEIQDYIKKRGWKVIDIIECPRAIRCKGATSLQEALGRHEALLERLKKNYRRESRKRRKSIKFIKELQGTGER